MSVRCNSALAASIAGGFSTVEVGSQVVRPATLRICFMSVLNRAFLMQVYEDIVNTIGNTPLIKLRRASEATSCTILGKAEFMNPASP